MTSKIDRLVSEGGKLWQEHGKTHVYFNLNVDASIYYDASLDQFIIKQKAGIKSLGVNEARICDRLDELTELLHLS
jgi:hypothetical protein